MAEENNKALLSCCTFVFVSTILHMFSHGYVEGRHKMVQKDLDLKPKGTIKTIRSDSDVIDCVDVYKQPAFDDPRIKELQMEPSTYPSAVKMKESYSELIQEWHKYGGCPKGTIPIRRSAPSDNVIRKKIPPLLHARRNFNQSLSLNDGHEYAVINVRDGLYHGASASINVWNPKTEDHELSASQIWVVSYSEDLSNLNSVEAGWIVFPELYRDNQTRFFIYWTGDGYQSEGCYDLTCSGFVQTNGKIAVGSIIPVSTYNGQGYEILIYIHKDESTSNWWLQLNGVEVGYWPGILFKYLSKSANLVSWGGEITNTKSEDHHTTTQMGSGHFPNEGYEKSSYFLTLATLDDKGLLYDPSPSFEQHVSSSSCYDLNVFPYKQFSHLSYMFYGGPGYSANCT